MNNNLFNMLRKINFILVALMVSLPAISLGNELLASPSTDNAKVYFIEPTNGGTFKAGEITVKFGLSGMGVAPAGVNIENTGHHHLLVSSGKDLSLDLSQPLPSNENVRHFGKGQTETRLSLEPGQYTMQLLLANHLHIPHDPVVISEKITILVE